MTENMEILLNKLIELGVFKQLGKTFEFSDGRLMMGVSGGKGPATITLFSVVHGERRLIGGISTNGTINHPSTPGALLAFEKILGDVVTDLIPRGTFIVDAPAPEPQSAEALNTRDFATDPVFIEPGPYLIDEMVGDVSHEWVKWYAKKHSVDNDHAWYQGMLLLIELNNKMTAFIGRSFAANIRHLSKPDPLRKDYTEYMAQEAKSITLAWDIVQKPLQVLTDKGVGGSVGYYYNPYEMTISKEVVAGKQHIGLYIVGPNSTNGANSMVGKIEWIDNTAGGVQLGEGRGINLFHEILEKFKIAVDFHFNKDKK